eukprot:COSAG06_NODE_51037_length_314_cov_1.818605_1_plen_56_part_01
MRGRSLARSAGRLRSCHMVALSLPRKVAGQEGRAVRHEPRVAAAPLAFDPSSAPPA